jgi:uncharacterized protein (TIGR04255 family)
MTESQKNPKIIYKNNQIQEAIFEMRFPVAKWDGTIPGLIYERVLKEFPERRPLQQINLFVSPSGTPPPFNPPPIPSVQFWNEKHSQLLQIGPGVATANSISYTQWQDFVPAIDILTKSCIELIKPERIENMSIRYINKFEFDDEMVLEKYFKLSLGLPEILSELSGFDLTFQRKIPREGVYKEKQFTATFSTIPAKENKTIIVLDIACATDKSTTAEWDKTVTVATELHDCVEDLFESIITDDLRAKLGRIQ